MSAIFGAYGPAPDVDLVARIAAEAVERGRDGGAYERFPTSNGVAWLGTHRASAAEAKRARNTSFGGIVHDGEITNGVALADVLDLSSFEAFEDSLAHVQGSYAIAAVGRDTVYLACNYKPLYYVLSSGAMYFASRAEYLADACPFGVAPVKLGPYEALDIENCAVVPLERVDSGRVPSLPLRMQRRSRRACRRRAHRRVLQLAARRTRSSLCRPRQTLNAVPRS
jgi:asparagine synthetase B (glutamine-hydrolysing)